jgi:hypothetical protein
MLYHDLSVLFLLVQKLLEQLLVLLQELVHLFLQVFRYQNH